MINKEHICNEFCPPLPLALCAWCHQPLGHTDNPDLVEGALCKACTEEVLEQSDPYSDIEFTGEG